MNSANNNNRQASKPAPPDPSWTYTETGVESGSFTPLDDGHEQQRVITGTRVYFDRLGINKRIEKAITTLTKKVLVTVLFDANSSTPRVDSDDGDSSREGSAAPPPSTPGSGAPSTCSPSPAVVVAAALGAQGPGYRSRCIDRYLIPHGSAHSTSSARTIVRIRARGNGSPAASGSGSTGVGAPNGEDVHGPRPRPLHTLSDDEEAERPSKKRKRDAF
ncbi:hypothetical protein HYPSUDRAFT_1100776 [Hypholoma sublateritium FD-334 SS-4]|uniref:Uncharacterized protein n=1 Tax=Hypholoma sublateritium (strain FD-334 SS-4) TaxID=945553 RepID=A0A0D2PCJ3_HYPSF|nr:hypothetical protein HYPSUDRAFT_1100776 [Hypholoma sublateritium FD-334 SS-4]